MYANRRQLGGFTDVLSDIVAAGRDVLTARTAPTYPTFPTYPGTPPLVPTGTYYPTAPRAADYTVPLLIGGGLLLLLMMGRRR